MKKIPLSQGKFALVDDEDFDALNRHKWYAFKEGSTYYAVRDSRKNEGGKRRFILMHRQILGLTGGILTDHKNGDGLDNRRRNLREATRSQNNRNRGKHKEASSRFKGVSWYAHAEKWAAGIREGGIRRHLGYFAYEIDAARAYDAAALELHGEFARTNAMCGLL